MKKRYLFPFLIMAFLAVGLVPVRAEASVVKYVDITLTEEERYNEDYYGEPKLRYPAGKARTFSRTADVSFEDYVVAALENLETTIDVSDYNLSATNAQEVGAEFNKLLNGNPQLFYIKKSGYTSSGDKIISLNIEYIDDEDAIMEMKASFEQAADLAAAQVDKSLDEYQQALIVHDYLALNCEYDYENYQAGSVPEISHTAYGSLVNQVAVCDGYADAFAYIMEDKLGISCEVISSDAMHHAWNMIEIGQKWYHVDVTWDDPAWDRIGRVMHENFLCSDSRISKGSPDAQNAENDNHYSWSDAHTADSTAYDDAFWGKIKSGCAICYQNGAWYYAKYMDDTKKIQFVKRTGDNFLEGDEEKFFEFDPWKGATETSYWQGCYVYLTQADGKLYFNTQDAMYRLGNDGSKVEVYSPVDLNGKKIYGFTVRGNELWYVLDSSPNDSTNAKQVIQKYALSQVEGISAENVTGTYSGNPFTIIVVGAQDTDTIEYMDADGNYQPTQPEMIDAGTYEVSYRVSREDHISYKGTAIVTIEQATPQYETPTGLSGYLGNALSTVTLPEGFTWQTDRNTQLEEEGVKQFLVKYTPQDTKNYKTITDIQVEVEVTENTQPVIPGISADDVEGTYNGEAFTITIQGLQAGDVVTYALEGGAYASQFPELKNAGTYEVLYKVERNGCQPFYGSVTVEIAKAVPAEDSYTIPTGCAGNSGESLSEVELPQGFAWKDGAAVLREEGSHNYLAVYTPEDTANYEDVEVEVAVEVTCPGHQYESEVTKEPTDTEEGEMTYTCTICGDTYTESIDSLLPAITGITASDVSGTYTGRPYRIQVEGTKAGDIVTYALKQVTSDDVGYVEEQPLMQTAGTYTVLYQVERSGYRPYRGSVTVEIARAIPNYTVPTNLNGVSGAALSTVELPEGFLWQSDPDTKMSKEGYQKFYVCYRPQDQVNYAVVTNIEISIYVECPGHQYEPVVTKEATETQKGIKTYTCKLCDRVYTEEMAMLAPVKPGKVSGLGVNNVSTNALSFSWKAEPGICYRLMFYEGDKLLSTKYATENTCMYQNLKPATIYTLKVTPYRVVNNQNVYARTTESVKAATNPLKTTLSSAKKKGKNKIKLNWKKVDGVSGYEIFMKTGNGKYKKIKTIGKAKTVSFTKTRLKRKKTYSFRIRTYVKVDGVRVYGAYSNVKKVKIR